jgi:putative FmdB family regulatory protein
MPTYMYRCNDCGHQQDDQFPMGLAPAEVRCFMCGGDAQKQFSAPSIRIR